MDVARISGSVEIRGIPESTRDLTTFAQTFDRVGASTDAHVKQMSGSFSAAAAGTEKWAQQIGALQDKIGFQHRAMEIARADLDALKAKEDAESLAVQKRQLSYDKLAASITQNETKLHGLQTALTAEAQAADHATTSTAALGKAAEHSGGSLSKMGELAKGAFTGIGFAAVNAGLNAVSGAFQHVESAIVETNAGLQDSATAWGVLLGSADAAGRKVQELFDFAAHTPYNTQQVDEAAHIMNTFGGELLDTTANLTLFGDAASGANKPLQDVTFWSSRLFDAIKSGTAIGEPLQNLQQLGLVSGETRKRMEELQKTGADGDQVWQAYAAGLQRFNGMMEKQSANFHGLAATFDDSINMLAATAGKPIFEALSTELGRVNTYLASPAASEAATRFADFAARGVQTTVDGLEDLYDVGTSTAAFLNNNLEPAIEAVSAATLAYGVKSLPAAISSLKTLLTVSDAAKLSITTTYLPLALLAGEFYIAAKGGQELNEKLHALAMGQEGQNKTFQRASEILQMVGADYGSTTPAIRDLAGQLDALTQKQVDYLAVASRRGGGRAGAESMREATKAAEELNPQIAELTDRLDMMAGAARQLEIDKLTPPKGVWSAYSGEVQGAVKATQELAAVPLTGDDLKAYQKALEDTASGTHKAFADMFTDQDKYQADSASLATKHWQTIAGIDAELHGKITQARRAELNTQRAEETAAYAGQTQDLKNALADQIAANRSAIGTMLRDRIEALKSDPTSGVDLTKANAAIDDITRRYGLLPDYAGKAAADSLSIVQAGIAEGSGRTTEQIGRDTDAIQRHYTDLEGTANNLRDLLQLQIETRMVGEDPVVIGQAVTREWGRAQALLAEFPGLAGQAFSSIAELDTAVAKERTLKIHTEAITGDVPERLSGIMAQADALDTRAPAYVRVQTDAEITKQMLEGTTASLDVLDRHPVVDKQITSNALTITGQINDTSSAYTGLAALPVPDKAITTNAPEITGQIQGTGSAYSGLSGLPHPDLHITTNAAEIANLLSGVRAAMGSIPESKTIRIAAGIDPMLVRKSPSPIEQVMMAITAFEKQAHIFRFDTVGDLSGMASYMGAKDPLAYSGARNLDGMGYSGSLSAYQFMGQASTGAADAIRRLLATGDFRGGIFGMQEDDPFIGFLLAAQKDATATKNILDLLKTGDFRGGILGLQEDDPFIVALLKASTTVQDLGHGLKLLGDQTPAIQDLGDGLTLLGDQWARQAATMTDLAPQLPNLAAGYTAVADAAKAAAATTARATDDILKHTSFKGDTTPARLAYGSSGSGMSIAGPSFGDTIALGTAAAADLGDGWQKGIEDITPVIQDSTRLSLESLQETVFDPWQTMTTDYLSGVGFGFAGALATGISSAGGDVAASAARVGGSIGGAISGGLQGSIGGVVSAVGAINGAIAGSLKTDYTVTVHVQYDDGRGTRGGPGGISGGGNWQRIAQSYGVS